MSKYVKMTDFESKEKTPACLSQTGRSFSLDSKSAKPKKTQHFRFLACLGPQPVAKRRPRRPQDASRGVQEDPTMRPHALSRHPKKCPRRPKRPRQAPNTAPRRPKILPPRSQDCPRRPKSFPEGSCQLQAWACEQFTDLLRSPQRCLCRFCGNKQLGQGPDSP